MNTKNEVLGVKVVAFNSEKLAKIEPPPLSEGLRQIIVGSGLQSLQVMVEPGNENAFREIIKNYWKVK